MEARSTRGMEGGERSTASSSRFGDQVLWKPPSASCRIVRQESFLEDWCSTCPVSSLHNFLQNLVCNLLSITNNLIHYCAFYAWLGADKICGKETLAMTTRFNVMVYFFVAFAFQFNRSDIQILIEASSKLQQLMEPISDWASVPSAHYAAAPIIAN